MSSNIQVKDNPKHLTAILNENIKQEEIIGPILDRDVIISGAATIASVYICSVFTYGGLWITEPLQIVNNHTCRRNGVISLASSFNERG